MKTIGIIGGVGPASSSEIYRAIMQTCHERRVAQRPRVLLDSVPLPLMVEQALLLEGKTEGFIPFLENSAKLLEDAGADIVVLACNTLHIHEDRIRANLRNAKFLSLTEAVERFLVRENTKRVGVLGTSVTAQSVFQDRLRNKGIEQLVPNPSHQKLLDLIILRTVTDARDEKDQEMFQEILSNLEQQNIDSILLGCTDLSTFLFAARKPVFDTVDILADIVTEEAFVPSLS